MKYIALIYAYISEPCDYQKIYANYQTYIPKAFEDYADFNGRLVIPYQEIRSHK